MSKKELMEIALLYVEKDYSYEQLMDGDDLYNATSEEKEICGEFWLECRAIGGTAFEKKIRDIKIVKN